MIRKHVDLIAIALLLSGIAVCSHAHNAMLLGVRSKRVWLATGYQAPRVIIPEVPRIPFARD
jgi:hypothetical protein